LVSENINYPKEKGNIVYIGESCKEKEPTGKRFSEHISTRIDKGGNLNSIFSLSHYYWNNKKLKLDIYLLNKKENRKKIEIDLLKQHVKKYASLPIGQGTTGKNYTVTNIEEFQINSDYKDII